MANDSKVRGMAIGDDKARIQATVTKEEKAIFDRLAADDYRTSSNFVGLILREWLKVNGHLK